MGRRAVFLERGTYRQRRLRDAIRLMPFLGLGLWMVPLFWPLPDAEAVAEPVRMSVALRYVFGVWAALVLIGWLLWRRSARTGDAAEPAD